METFTEELPHLIREHLVVHGGLHDRIRHLQTLTAKQLIPFQHPVQDTRHIFRFRKEALQSLILLFFIKVAVKGNDFDTTGLEQGQVRDVRTVVRVDEDLEVRTELEAILMQISGRNGVVTSQAFGQGSIQRDLLLRL